MEAAKSALQADSLLVHYDESKLLVLACDASLSHIMEDGQERPVAYASRTLTSAEKNYSQLEKEGLAIIFGAKKFHNYLFGRKFSIESDHQSLSYLFNETKGISQTASSRIQRWALTLSAYQYTIRHKPGATLTKQIATTHHILSRLSTWRSHSPSQSFASYYCDSCTYQRVDMQRSYLVKGQEVRHDRMARRNWH